MLVVLAALLLAIAPASAVLLLWVAASAISWLRVLEGALAILAVDVDPAIVAVIPFGDPWWWDLRRAVVGFCLLAVGLLRWIALTLALIFTGVSELADEVVEE